MRKIISIIAAAASIIFVTALVIRPITAQSAKKKPGGGMTISENVMNIAERSCGNCHSEPGNIRALPRVNLSFWDKFSPEKQAAKAKAMGIEVSNDRMPPKKYREKHPDSTPTNEEIKTICDWAQSLQTAGSQIITNHSPCK